MPRTLPEFVSFFRSQSQQREELLGKMADIYARVWPCKFDDKDLQTFLGLLYCGVRFYRPSIVVQTGTFVGTSTVAISLAMRANRRGELFTIDPEPPEYFGVPNPVSIARRAVSAGRLDRHVEFVRGYSTIPGDRQRMHLPSAQWWRLTNLPTAALWNMFVVDGDHTYVGCSADLHYGGFRIKRQGRGLVVVHDYIGIPEVRRAVRQWRNTVTPLQSLVVPSPCGIALIQV